MWPLPVGDLYMAGKSSVEVLHKLGIRTIGELANTDPSLLELHLKSHGITLWEFANGRSGDKVIREHVESKGIGHSTTLPQDLSTEEEACKVLLRLAEMVGKRVRKEHKKAKMISVEIKYNTFQSVSHQKQLVKASSADLILYEAACELFKELWNGAPIRLLGIRTSKLVDETEPEQMSIFDFQTENEEKQKKQEKQQKLDEALDQVRKRFGEKVITKGSLK
jgi:DNA polymerase-4